MMLHQNIRTIRKAYGLSQEQFAKHFHVKKGAISTYEIGKINPPYEFIIALSKFCGLSIHDIITKLVIENQNYKS